MALFPLALPMIALLAVAAIPLLLMGLLAGVLAAVVAAPVVAVRRLRSGFARERSVGAGRSSQAGGSAGAAASAGAPVVGGC